MAAWISAVIFTPHRTKATPTADLFSLFADDKKRLQPPHGKSEILGICLEFVDHNNSPRKQILIPIKVSQ
ncbi:hypothetical protein KDD30_10085 [Photobacterium sp. GJ3]|uniref:hypothetical protein n=1 Tax=Photobacterium sp. GJ3 TaxID=2829502 RepID=UPI001B8AA899|nr:hypothetical protein [Photobacterium sp. GJ3]QUJ66514.1 hypothetical protein KDD30_10085 [Photobacterium sp. GJ3]